MRVHVPKVNSILKQTLHLFPALIPATNHRLATAFCVSTIILGAENLNLKSNLKNKGIATTSAILSTTIQPLDMSKYRLPKSVKPVKYDLYLYPNLTTGNFSGKVLANVVVNEDTPFVKMHNKKLSVKKVSINDEDAVAEIDEEFELLVIKKANGEVIRKSDSTNIEVVFEGDMKNRIVGLYTSTYQGKDGPRTIATSKFEPTYARQAFPCFDEPNMKASFKVHLWKPSDTSYIALSNNPVESEEDFEGGKLVHFEETVPMSTYLSCFIVSDFQCTSTEFDNDGILIPFKVYATPEQLVKTKYAGTVGKNIIEYYVKYFGIAYPLPKLDMVAIPDFVSGAMEHWGLVTYRETALLYTNETHSTINKQRVLVVIAHELAHSWFGNLVTMDWWDNLWLNEGFASYIEYKGANAAEPTFGMMDQFIVEHMHPVLNLDAKLSSHPIIKPVITPDQITEVFDPISYNKGASILRMLEYAVGSNTFSVAVKNYLNKYKYGNAVTKDLWDEIQNIVGSSIDVTTFMDSFTVQMGYPILDISESNGKLILRQRRFLTNSTNAKDENSTIFGYRWTIPISFVTDKTKSDTLWFKYDDEQVEIDKPDNIKWIKFNPNQIGYYRVNYTTELWSRLADHFHELEVADRTHILEESFSIANAGQLSYKVPLDITENLKNETEYLPWKTAGDKFNYLKRLLRESPHEPQFKKYVISILKNAHDNLSWNIKAEDSHLQRLARIQVLTLACEFGYDFAIEKASTLHDIWLQNRIADPDLRSIIYKYGMVNATEYKWSKVSKLFEDEKDANEKLKLLTGLAAVQDPYLLKRLIEAAKSESYIRGQDYFACLQYIASNPVGTPIVWDYVRENWEYLVNRFTLNDRYLGRLITVITSSFATKTKLAEVENFFEMNPEAGAGAAARKEALENINNNINWLVKFQKPVEEWITRSN